MKKTGSRPKSVAFFDLYFDRLGGGEQHLLDVFTSIQENFNANCFLVIPSNFEETSPVIAAERRFGKSYKNISVLRLSNYKWKVLRFINRLIVLSRFDIVFTNSNDLPQPLLTSNNVGIIQFPYIKFGNFLDSLYRIISLASYRKIICNSEYVSLIINRRLKVNAEILYPTVETLKGRDNHKRNIILSVGRFFEGENNKKHADLIKSFMIFLQDRTVGDWELWLMGGVSGDAGQKYFDQIKESACNLPIKLFPNASREQIGEAYQEATLYWHAAGLGEDPESGQVEHFGISIVEALSNGCVVVATNAGGIPEVLENGKVGVLVSSVPEFAKQSLLLIKDPSLLEKYKQAGVTRSADFNHSAFQKRVQELFSPLFL